MISLMNGLEMNKSKIVLVNISLQLNLYPGYSRDVDILATLSDALDELQKKLHGTKNNDTIKIPNEFGENPINIKWELKK